MKISVYITVYNVGSFLSKAIASVISQTLKPYEIVIIDDCSTDNSQDIIRNYYNKYPDLIKPIYNNKNLGITKSRNIALSHCSGEIITYLDGDDIYYPEKIKLEYGMLKKNTELKCVFSNFNYIDENGNNIGQFASVDEQPISGEIFSSVFARQMNVRSGGSLRSEMFYKDCLIKTGLYDEKLLFWDDWDLHIRMSKYYQFGYCPNINSAYRKWSGSINAMPLEYHFRDQIRIYNKNKILIQDLLKNEQSFINNRVYAKIKGLFIDIIKKTKRDNNFFHTIYYCIYFISTFRTRKSISEVLNSLHK